MAQDATNSTAWVGNVTRITRDEVDVDMHARLTRCFTDIDTNVVSIR